MYQLKLAIEFGDPTIVARSKLYIAIALIQKDQLRAAKHIIRQQYKFSIEEKDDRLVKMCLGIWMKLQYSYLLRKKAKESKQKNKR